jgi:hypothetical protein
MPSQHPVKVDNLFTNRQVPHASHQVSEMREAAPKSRLLGPPPHHVIALLVARAVMGEAQEVNRLGPLSPTLRRMPLGKPTKFNEPRLTWFQYKPKPCQAFAKRVLQAQRIRPILETHHKVINVPHQAGLAFHTRLDHPVKPQVQHIVKVHITH